MANLIPILLNNVYSTVQAGSSAIGSASATGINVATGAGANFGTIGTNQFIPAVIVDTSTTPETVKEYVWITARSTDALTVVRQAEESSRFPASTTTVQAGYTVAAVATSAASAIYQQRESMALNNLFAWSVDPSRASGSVSLGGNGRLYVARIPLPVGAVISKIHVGLVAAGATLTSGQNFAMLWDASAALIGQTVDQSTAWVGTPGNLPMSLASSVTVTSRAGYGFVGVYANGTTRPTFASSSSAGSPTADLNIGNSTDGYRMGLYAGGGYTTTPPSTLPIASLSSQSQIIVFGLS